MSFATLLPQPQREYEQPAEAPRRAPAAPADSAPRNEPPPYLQRRGWRPTCPADFGDGGAFPEIHQSQFPLDMGRPGSKGKGGQTAIVPMSVDGQGNARFDSIVTRQGSNRGKKVFSSMTDLVERRGDAEVVRAPTEDEEAETAERTRAALEAKVSGKVAATRATFIPKALTEKKDAQFIRYTPAEDAPGRGPEQRVIKMMEIAEDPMEPSKHKNRKVARGPPSPPVPVMHSPPRKLTAADQAAWKIPPCVSNYKNSAGYTIPLDKRLAADGRGLQEATINDKFATMAEALYIAERKAREQVKVRADIERRVAVKQKEQEEEKLREMAMRARQERGGMAAPRGRWDSDSDDEGGDAPVAGSSSSRRSRSRSPPPRGDDAGRRERDRIREEQRRELEREYRKEASGRAGKGTRDEGRDVSEKIALGMHTGGGKLEGEAQFDARLFNQSQGLGSGFGGDDEYSVYSKKLFDRGEQGVYRPKASDSEAYGDADANLTKIVETERFKADLGFKGADQVKARGDEPVQFEREAAPAPAPSRRRSRSRSRSPARRSTRSRSRSRDRR